MNPRQENKNVPKPVVLISMDGVGVAAPGPGNAVTLAKTTNLDKYWPTYPHGMLESSGLYVGLPEGTDGNSEVGHMAMGAGKIILQDLPRIDNAIKNESFYENPMLEEAFNHAKKFKSSVHLIGLIGTGSVHSSFDHLVALLNLANRKKFDPDKVFIHVITDGRDSPPDSAITLLEKLEAVCIQKHTGRIASIIGRGYALDRDKNWARIKLAYDLYTEAKGKIVSDWAKELKEHYNKKIFDQFIEPTCIIDKHDKKVATITENDAVIFFNFRPDRAQQLTRAFEEENFPGWQRKIIPNLYFVGFTDYKKGFPKIKAFPPETITTPVGKVISAFGLYQLRISESEKFPHVTYFFNGGSGSVFPGEKWLEVPSPKDVATFDQKPEMSQRWVTDVLIENINKGEFDFILVNFAGPDMVAHTGVIPSTIKAMEVCDECIGRIVEATLAVNGAVVITADHGNAEEMINLQNGEPDTKHSVNQVPVLVIKKDLPALELPLGTLADIAPTILGLLGLPIPAEMSGRNLLE
jgi:2,3-bisphosphoglycerate-independent phosphoglycerate mutase